MDQFKMADQIQIFSITLKEKWYIRQNANVDKSQYYAPLNASRHLKSDQKIAFHA
jgi:hypothetical protein